MCTRYQRRSMHSYNMATGKDLPCILVQEMGGSFGVMEEHVDYLEERFTLITMKELKEKKEQVADKIVCIFNWANKPDIDRELLECLPRLKVIASAGAGVDHLNLKMISSYGVKVANTPNAVTNATADLAMTLLLVSARSFLEGHKIAMSPDTDHFHANWVSRGDITGNTVGIVGMGKIGYKIAQRAKAFEMKILYHNRHQRLEEEKSVGATYCENLTDLLQQSDYVILVVNLTPQTEKLIGRRELKLMKPSATLINVSRGPVVDQDALVEALQVGEIKAAALDVTYPEPLPRDHPLLKLSNVIIAPHMGTATRDSLRAMMEDMVQSMMDAVNSHSISFEVTDI
ncbi:glyoxylate/hydroxypyruvate reductase B-like isoform X2 [Rana temporaria]|uniref:glyoxylate/hydroxypyruvate reductase B-like isoform X2 n=1 Tax=Rana temporaria TaxID=8407 RepID=UPI001AAC5956|nr:glyoxylate/hydroxypyruvate reductase B-like isoform X2 [Rana temporaria]XP_040209770.1 glyoxylate/hydroxypyruvate reductase B-like isoform X2 [Rana temporaria]